MVLGNASAAGGQRSTSDGMATALLTVRDLEVRLPTVDGGTLTIVDGVSLEVEGGETLGVVGESGSGKTMTALALLRLLPRGALVSGEILLDGVNLLGLTERQMRRKRGSEIAMILQDPMASLNPAFTIGQQVSEALRIHRGLRGSDLRTATVDILRKVRISEAERRMHDYPHQLSGGMRQRAVGAIMLSAEPRMLIADEPTTALDTTVQAQYLELLAELQGELRFGMVLISHDMGVIASSCSSVAVMYAGKIVESGPATDVLVRPSHPYTSDLLGCLPKLHEDYDRLISIEGQPPNPRNLPPGCRYAPRCARADGDCTTAHPSFSQRGTSHRYACYHPLDNG